ncbi:hypothetical protein KSP39_PZI004689 [Platanthera zijinensis]|uniref:RING-CH-type domain-containing protein n=1 Tax=Platanthera zijinensis TaxID=2320716 RepID=A0AAP0GDB3_9ASPA
MDFESFEEIRLSADGSKSIPPPPPSSSSLRLCRICHEEEEQDTTTMETPCACSGTLKFAHRGCVQRWCDRKGSTICEICLKVRTLK